MVEVGLYESMYPELFEELRIAMRNEGRVHGSWVRDWLLEIYPDRGYLCEAGFCESVLKELGWVPETLKPDMTLSQRAFLGLHNPKKHPGYVGGCKEHFWHVVG